jgi:hypothetical protein
VFQVKTPLPLLGLPRRVQLQATALVSAPDHLGPGIDFMKLRFGLKKNYFCPHILDYCPPEKQQIYANLNITDNVI